MRYANVGTGNFNKDTAKIFSDVSLFTADTRITADVHNMFKFFEDVLKICGFSSIEIIKNPCSEKGFDKRPIWITRKL